MFSLYITGQIEEKCVDCGNIIPRGMIREDCIDHEGFFARHIDCKNLNKKPTWYLEVPQINTGATS